MTLDEAARIARNPKGERADYVTWATACAMIYANHERLKGRAVRPPAWTDAAAPPPRRKTIKTFLRVVENLRDELHAEHAAKQGTTMPMPSGILPEAPPIDPRTGIPLPGFGWLMPKAIAEMSPRDLALSYRANDAARSKRLLQRINDANARFWEKRR